MESAVTAIRKEDLKEGERHLILCDNLNGQTKKCNPQFLSLLDKMCSCDVWNLLAGNTDEIQVVDAGLGKLVKDIAEDEACDWMGVEENWNERTAWAPHYGISQAYPSHSLVCSCMGKDL